MKKKIIIFLILTVIFIHSVNGFYEFSGIVSGSIGGSTIIDSIDVVFLNSAQIVECKPEILFLYNNLYPGLEDTIYYMGIIGGYNFYEYGYLSGGLLELDSLLYKEKHIFIGYAKKLNNNFYIGGKIKLINIKYGKENEYNSNDYILDNEQNLFTEEISFIFKYKKFKTGISISNFLPVDYSLSPDLTYYQPIKILTGVSYKFLKFLNLSDDINTTYDLNNDKLDISNIVGIQIKILKIFSIGVGYKILNLLSENVNNIVSFMTELSIKEQLEYDIGYSFSYPLGTINNEGFIITYNNFLQHKISFSMKF